MSFYFKLLVVMMMVVVMMVVMMMMVVVMMMMVVVINIMKAFLVLFEFVTREACKGQGCSGRFGLVTARRKYLFVVYLVTIRAKGSSSANQGCRKHIFDNGVFLGSPFCKSFKSFKGGLESKLNFR